MVIVDALRCHGPQRIQLCAPRPKQWDVGFNAVGLVDGYTTPVVKALTGNNTTIYAAVFVDLGRDGPVVKSDVTARLHNSAKLRPGEIYYRCRRALAG